MPDIPGLERSGAGAPKCKLCGINHWLRVGCDGNAQGTLAATNTPREGHGVLKGAKPTPSASAESPDPTHKGKQRRKAKRKAKRGVRKT